VQRIPRPGGRIWNQVLLSHDERATIPQDQRDIFLRGVEIYRNMLKNLVFGIDAEFTVLPMVGIQGSITKQDDVFLFDSTPVSRDDKYAKTQVTSNEL